VACSIKGSPRVPRVVFTVQALGTKGRSPSYLCTLFLSRGVHPKIVQEMLGHSSTTITLDTYSHVLPNMQEKAVEAMEDILDGKY
jgi:integrase